MSYAAERLFEKTGDVFYADADSEPIRTALQMHRKLKNGYRSEPYECGVFLYQFFCSLLREVQRPERKQAHFFVREAIRQMDTDCASVQGIEQLAEQSRVSFAHFTRCFREETGVSPMQYLQEARIPQSDDAALEYRKECGRDCSRNRIFQWKLFWKSIPSPYGNLAVGIPERTAERCRSEI